MDPLLFLIATLIILHCGLFLFGLAQLHMISRQIPSVLAAGLMIASMILAMIFGSWGVLIISFVLYQSWTMLEGLLLQGKISTSSLALAPINLISIAGSLVAFFSGLWIIFGGTYLFHWAMTLIVGKRVLAKASS